MTADEAIPEQTGQFAVSRDSGDAAGATAAGGEHAPGRRLSAEEREALAEQTLKRIFAGGDLGQEALELSNGFTDEHTARFRAWIAARAAAVARPFRRSQR